MDMRAIRLEPPSAALLPQYAAALRQGWSPNNTRDVSGEQLAAIAADPAAFLDDFTWSPGRTVTLGDGSTRARLPGATFWIDDGAFCGAINLRYVPGTGALPPHVLGHVGYAVVPWKRRQGIAGRALRALLPHAWAAGLAWVTITADADNVASQRVILASGGLRTGLSAATALHEEHLVFWVLRPAA